MVRNFNGTERSGIKLAAMHLNWNLPVGERFIPWLKEVKEAGYDGITGFSHWGLETYINQPGLLKRLLDDNGLSLAAIDAPLHDDYDKYKPVFEFMQFLDCKLFVCIDPSGTDKHYAKYGDMLNRVGHMALTYGINAHYHNHTNAVGETFTDMEKLMAELDFGKVSLMLDTGHATKDFTEWPVEDRAFHFLEKYWNLIHYLEFKDWNEATDLNTPLGEGYADYNRIFELMRKKGYDGWITIEQNGDKGLSKGRSPVECARISREFIRNGLGV
jgi:sugar phosphate isomerase/epimerase